ncbi:MULTISPECIES: hypothetical protein [Pseudomonas]|uniref:Uncharacterized protein n=1 Tax=Pseudomonas fluorescens TaxID=294 RepID=A0A161ZF63_PSEFL|nr:MULTISPECIES: hypothetical protein [Pseudomonas]KZN20522.1 hypothetical protein A1D17_02985 [Pseudomonas fluorescens]
MATFNIYFNGTCIDQLENSTARKALNHIKRSYKNPEQCVAAPEDADQAEAMALSKKLHIQNEEFEQEIRDVEADTALTTAARKRSGETVVFTNKNAGPTHGIAVLTTDGKWITLLEGKTHEEAREFMRNFNGRPEHVPAKVIKTKFGIVAGFSEPHQIVQETNKAGYEKRFVNVEAAQEFIDTYGDAGYALTVADCEIVDFSYDLFTE